MVSILGLSVVALTGNTDVRNFMQSALQMIMGNGVNKA
jgi:hypothetical protein